MLGKRKSGQNYLEQIPERNPKLTWKEDESGIVILDMVHQGLFDKIAQGLFATPEGQPYPPGGVWQLYLETDRRGSGDLAEIGALVKAEFGDRAEPLYERLAQYFETLAGNHFISYR